LQIFRDSICHEYAISIKQAKCSLKGDVSLKNILRLKSQAWRYERRQSKRLKDLGMDATQTTIQQTLVEETMQNSKKMFAEQKLKRLNTTATNQD